MIASLTHKNIERNLSCARMCVECLRLQQFLQLFGLPQSRCKTKFAHIRPKNFGSFWRCLIIVNPRLFFTSYSMTSLTFGPWNALQTFIFRFSKIRWLLWWVCVCRSKFFFAERQITSLYCDATTSLINLLTSVCEFILLEAVIWRPSSFPEKSLSSGCSTSPSILRSEHALIDFMANSSLPLPFSSNYSLY